MKKRIKITAPIYTHYAQKDEVSDAIIQIEQTSYYISALFWFMKTACDGYDLLDLQTDRKLFTFGEFRENVQLVSQIGTALSDQLTVYSNTIAVKGGKKDEH